MRKYLVPIGDAEHSVNTLQFAIDLASEVGAEVYVVNLVGTSTRADDVGRLTRVLLETSEKNLESLLQQVDTKGVSVLAKPVIGKVDTDIERIGKSIGAHLIVLSSSTAEYKEDTFLGRISGSLAKHASIPVLVVPPGTEFKPFSRVLFAFKSGVMRSASVKESLQIMLEKWGAKIVPMQVVTPGMEEEEKVISTSLLQVAEAPKIVECNTVLEAVQQETQANDYSLLCMIRRKRSFISKLLENNAVKRTDFETDLPLLILN